MKQAGSFNQTNGSNDQGNVLMLPAETPLTATGATPARQCYCFFQITCAVVVAAIGTSVIVQLEGSLNGTNWGIVSGTSATTITTNGCFFLVAQGRYLSVRLNLTTINTGTPSVTPQFLFGEP